ncbi:MAG: lysine--tRNA ligase, partial [Mailhella sp.]|nr:lysine--tRNA ligase [Mailhella sp.]
MEEQKKARKPIKLATKSEHAAYFMPMLESFADHGELNEVVKNCVGKACDLLDSGVALYPNDFKRTHDAGVVFAEYENASEEALEALETEFALAGRMMSSRSFG